jgi:hypothetical protein
MKKITLSVLAAALVLSVSAATKAAAAADGLAASAELDIVSKYVWRGISLSKDEAYQPSVTLSKYGFTGNAWLNYSMDTPQRNEFNEFDYTLSYERKVRGVTVSPGFALYTYSKAASLGEAYVKFSLPLAAFKIFTDHYLSMVSGDVAGGYYGDAGLGCEKELPGGSLWAGTALLGWGNAKFNSFSYGTPGLAGQLNVLVLDTAVTVKLSDRGSLRPHLTFHATLPGGLRSAIRAAGNTPDNLVLGLAAGYSF